MKIDVNNSIPQAELQKQLKACRDFESYFIKEILKEMRKTIPKSDLLGGNSFAKDTYYDMLDQQTAENISKSGGFGLADNFYRNIFQRQLKGLNPEQISEIYKGASM